MVAADVGPDSVTLTWSQPEPELINGIIRHYLIYLSHVTSPPAVSSHRTSSSVTTHTISGLHPYTHYSISVAAVTISAGPSSDNVEFLTEEDGKQEIIIVVESVDLQCELNYSRLLKNNI